MYHIYCDLDRAAEARASIVKMPKDAYILFVSKTRLGYKSVSAEVLVIGSVESINVLHEKTP